MRHEFPFVWFLVAFAAYTALLFLISWITGRKAGSNSFFSGDKKAPWPVVAYGMIGASISGVTFISVPGNVWVQNFFYMPLVLGFVGGYIIPLRHRLPRPRRDHLRGPGGPSRGSARLDPGHLQQEYALERRTPTEWSRIPHPLLP